MGEPEGRTGEEEERRGEAPRNNLLTSPPPCQKLLGLKLGEISCLPKRRRRVFRLVTKRFVCIAARGSSSPLAVLLVQRERQ